MQRIGLVIVLVFLLGAPGGVFASQEGILAWSSFSVHSAGIGNSGPVDVSGDYGDAGLTRLTINAFGRTFTLSRAQLQEFKGVHLNGMRLSYEAGYAELGGRTAYLVLSMGFTSGTRAAKLVTVNERGDISITDNRGE